MNDETKTALAYDPITDEDVEIECRPRHRRIDYETIDGTELPVLTATDFRHDPVEGCQGSYTEIVEIEDGCPNCGYDRAKRSVHTLAGEHSERCIACDVNITGRDRDDWAPSRRPSAERRLKQDANYLGKAGEVTVYGRGLMARRTIGLLRNGTVLYLRPEDAAHIAKIAIDNGYDEEENPLPTWVAHPLLAAMARVSDTDDGGDDDAE